MVSIILVFTYQGRVRRYCSEPPLAFLRTEVSKAAQRLTVGQAVPEIPLSIGSKLEQLKLLLRAFKFPYTSPYTHAFVRVCILLRVYVYIILLYTMYMTEAPRVLHFSAFIKTVTHQIFSSILVVFHISQ